MITSAEEFVALRTSADRNNYTRAAHDSASIEVWTQVIDHYPDMRFWVAQNKTVPLDILVLLAQDEDPRVRYMVASKRKATGPILTILATDPDDSVRLAVAKHRNTPRSVLEELRQDSWETIAEIATARLQRE